jgi:NAD(P)H dehydrogenase (quinone)
MTIYAVTAASGQLGRLVIEELLRKLDAREIVAIVRDPSKLSDLAGTGIAVRQGDYDDPESLRSALSSVDRLLLISGSAVGERVRQHGNVIDAAREAEVQYVAYTSILKGDRSQLPLAAEHVATERLLAQSGLNFDLLHNGWYSENYTMGLAHSVESGKLFGASGDGRLSTASRADYAAGAAAALVNSGGGQTYELAGDESWTMRDFAEEVSRQSGKAVEYVDLPEAEYAGILESVGLPPPVASMLAKTSALSGEGELYDEGRQLSALIGRPTTPIRDTIAAALGA